MNKAKTILITWFILFGLFLYLPLTPVKGAPPIQTDENAQDESTEEKKKEDLSKADKKGKKKKKKMGVILSRMKKYLEKEEKKLRVRANIFSSKLQISDCTAADKARARLDDVGDSGGIVVKEDLNISSQNEAEIGKNEGSITNITEVNIINEVNKRC